MYYRLVFIILSSVSTIIPIKSPKSEKIFSFITDVLIQKLHRPCGKWSSQIDQIDSIAVDFVWFLANNLRKRIKKISPVVVAAKKSAIGSARNTPNTLSAKK